MLHKAEKIPHTRDKIGEKLSRQNVVGILGPKVEAGDEEEMRRCFGCRITGRGRRREKGGVGIGMQRLAQAQMTFHDKSPTFIRSFRT